MTTRRYDSDLFVAGGGPAGLAAAIAAAMRGLSVTVADVSRPLIDKACGEGLMPDSLAALAALGMEMGGVPSAPFVGIRFLSGEHRAEARFPEGTGRGVRRTALHALLLARAESLGVRLCWGSRVTGLEKDCVTLSSRTVRARWIVGADGLQSRMRAWAGLDHGPVRSRRIGLRQHFRLAPWTDFVEVYWGERGQAYVTPVASDQIGVAFIARTKHTSIEAALDSFPELRARLAGASGASAPRGSLTLGRQLDRVVHGCVALVGDASGSVDAITGEGVGLSVRQAAHLADALCRGDLASYQSAHTALQRAPMFMSQAMLLMDRSRWVRHRTLAAFERSPELFARMLRVHVGASPLRFFGDAGVLHLGWRLLTAQRLGDS